MLVAEGIVLVVEGIVLVVSSRGDRASSRGDRASSRGDRASSRGDRASSRGDRASSRGDRASSRLRQPFRPKKAALLSAMVATAHCICRVVGCSSLSSWVVVGYLREINIICWTKV